MAQKKLKIAVGIINIFIFSAVMFFHTVGHISISIKTATPLILLPFITAYSAFGSLGGAVCLGFFAGAFMDSVTIGSYCFNTIIFIILSVFVFLGANNIFNKNIRGIAVLALITACVYFIVKWLFFFAFGVSMSDSLLYLLKYALPSAVYSAVFIIPFYYIYRFFNKLLNN